MPFLKKNNRFTKPGSGHTDRKKRWQKERARAAFSIQGVIGMCFLPETRGLTSPETVPRATPFKWSRSSRFISPTERTVEKRSTSSRL